MAQLVSILIPAYNAEKWIAATIESALNQSWSRKEIIVVDDGSKDNTLAIAKQFESRSLKVIAQENKGASAARNKALSFAQGEYIQWLDADDLLAANKILAQMKLADAGQTSLTLLSSPHGVFHWRPERARFVRNSLWQDLFPVEWLINLFSENVWMSPVGWLVSRRLTENVGPWDERLSLNDDGEYFCRVVASAETVRFVPEARCYYRLSSFNQLSFSDSESACKSLLLSVELSVRYLRSLEGSERTRRASLLYLQRTVPYFYPEKTELLKRIHALALELGGQVVLPRVGWKFELAQMLFGWKAAKVVLSALRTLKLGIRVKWDETMYRLGV